MTAVDFNPYDWLTAHNPYPVYQRLRDEAPVYHNERFDFWALSRHADVQAAHADPVTWSSAGGVTIEGFEKDTPLLIVKDPPEHTWHRKVVARVFTPKRIADLEPFIRSRAGELLDRWRDVGEFDVVSDFSTLLPLDVISELIGIPRELRPTVHELSDQIALRDHVDDEGFTQQTFADNQVSLLDADLVRYPGHRLPPGPCRGQPAAGLMPLPPGPVAPAVHPFPCSPRRRGHDCHLRRHRGGPPLHCRRGRRDPLHRLAILVAPDRGRRSGSSWRTSSTPARSSPAAPW